jgi:hypothetical protein
MKYIWWIGDKTGQVGSWPTKAKAQKAIDNGLKIGFLDPKKDWQPIRHEVENCPSCGRLAEKEIIQGLGECLNCDHIRGDI